MLKLKKLWMGFFLGLSAVLSVNAAVPNPVTSQNQAIVVKPHQIFKIQLASNPTTGYSWFVKSYDKHLIKVIKHTFQKPTQRMPGAGGREVWTLKSTAAFNANSKTQITFVYARPWEKSFVKTAIFTIQGSK